MNRSTGSFTARIARTMRWSIAVLLTLAAVPANAQQDLSVAAIAAPQSGCALSSTENVTVRIFNYGSTLAAGSSFTIGYTINSGNPVMELITLGSTLFSNSTFNYTFTTQANLAAPGTYTLNATVSISGDINPTNNASSGYQVTNDATSVGGTVSTTIAGSSGTLSLSGNTGSVEQWEESEDGGQRWFALSNQSNTQAYANVRVTTQFRARVQSGACPAVVSGVAVAVP